ncbi:brachyurin-like [Agrilus planipennis]|uniref:Brachyurin-like n=1 Tax=Agrilus planipennis TaxID=224129 RepID=A0A7F5RJ08_AGRPL|nr:brachyurin-like [Agrilus planipennis]
MRESPDGTTNKLQVVLPKITVSEDLEEEFKMRDILEYFGEGLKAILLTTKKKRNGAGNAQHALSAGLVLIYDSGQNFCGGSLITRRYVLTAAHCLFTRVESLIVILGAHRIRETESTQQRIPTTNYKLHEQYNNNTLENDLAMVYLPTPANLNRYVQLIALPSRADVSNSFVGSEARASGWGFTSSSGNDISAVLRYINVPVISNDVCRRTFNQLVRAATICSSGEGRKGLCFGDSGGPLVVDGKLVGVASFVGYNGCEGGEPSAFSRVTSFLNWIDANSDAVIS